LKADAQHLVRLSQDFERLDKVLETLASIEDRTRVSKDAQERYILATSAAYELQQLYTGFEKIIERHLHFTGSVITPGGAYHKQLLSWALNERLVVTKIDTEFLTDLLGFRHFVRSAYGITLNSKETFRKVGKAIKRWPLIAKRLKRQFGLSETGPDA
jgi:hypothetical protein